MIDYKILAAGTMALIFTLSLPGGASAAFASGEVGAAAGTDISLSLAQNRRGAGKGGKKKKAPRPARVEAGNNPMHPSASRAVQEKAGLFNTGVVPLYPAGGRCLEIASAFGDQTRYDGSHRVQWANHGYHGGSNISADVGTPLVALADGEVVHAYSGARLVGHQIIMRHAPEDTGLPIWIYSKYKHFREPPDFAVGERVRLGQVLGFSGNSGTTGGHFGAEGYPHLHFSIYAARTGQYKSVAKSVIPRDVFLIDPAALYLLKNRQVYDNHAVRALTAAQKRVEIPYMTETGEVVPAGSRLIWPFKCTAK